MRIDLRRPPDAVRAFGAEGLLPLDGHRVAVTCEIREASPNTGAAVRVELTASVPVSRVHLRWRGDLSAVRRYLPDAWERSYGDLGWFPERAERVLPWSFVADPGGDGTRSGATGVGVGIGPGALCCWTADAAGVSLWADVRCGGSPVLLGERTLHIADVVTITGAEGESPFAVQRRLCRAMAASTDRPARLPDHPVYGANDWHYALGRSDRRSILSLAQFTSACAGETAVRPYLMVDDGWSSGGLGHGPWIGNRRYGHMGELARALRDAGVRPGLWYRPLTPLPEHGDRWRLARGGGVMDPSVPEVRQSIAHQVQRLADWGYELVKHDFTVWDVVGRWGFQMGAAVTDDGWSFADRGRTTAEVLTDLYRLLRAASGPAMVMGCNAFGHLVAGHAELQRVGDDASGRSWNRTRRMAVNALAFRAAQHGALYAVDADVAPITAGLPWRQSVQWLHLLAASGTPAFVSVDEASRTPSVAASVRDAFTLAASEQTLAEPLDWARSATPSRWRLGGHTQTYDWLEDDGAWPFAD